MRSDKIHRALKQGMNRFEMCQLVSKGVRATHKTGGRFEDTINECSGVSGFPQVGQEDHASGGEQSRGKILETRRIAGDSFAIHTYKNEKDGCYAVLFWSHFELSSGI